MNARRIHDKVHGDVRLPALAQLICATREFQRLDRVRQLGAASLRTR
jgi:HD superfamily phosphohydrolase